MRLKTIKLAGFKSFVDPTIIPLQSALTAVVGPNGCGKSNIVDAIRWVIGESSAKQLRGESLTDVIFNGTANRKPIGQAAIELIFDNSDGGLGGEYARYGEIAVRRELSRDGQSQFYLNAARCRRRDIMDIFLGTGLGPRSYSIIEQGMISQLIEAKPEDIRVYLEEAAGISKYKERRRETENRIGHTRENLARLTDLREEIDKQLAHLKRQANAAERFKVLKEEQRLLKAQLQALYWRDLDGQIIQQQSRIQEQETQLEAKVAEHRHIDTELEKQRTEQIELNDIFNEIQGRYYQFGTEIARQEQRIQHIQERQQQLEADLTQIDASWSESEQLLEDDQAQIEALNAELLVLEPNAEQAAALAEQLIARLQEAEQQMADEQTRWDSFNSQAAQTAQKAEVEQTRLQHLAQKIQGLQQRIQRIQEQRNHLEFGTLPDEVTSLAEQSAGLKQQIETLQNTIAQFNAQITQQRHDNQQMQSQRDSARNHLQNFLSRQASLEALQNAALGKTDQTVIQWLEQHQLASNPRLAEGLEVEQGWEFAVETILGPYLEAVCVDGVNSFASALQNFAHGKLTLLNTQAKVAANSAEKSVTLASKIQTKWSLTDLLDGVYVAESLVQAMALVPALSAHESVITREGVWLGPSWVRISKDSDEKVGILQRKQELQELDAAIIEQQAKLKEYEDRWQHGQATLIQLEENRDQHQQQFRDSSSKFSEVHAQLSAKQVRLEQLRQRESMALQELQELQQQLDQTQELHDSVVTVWQQALQEKKANEQQRASLLQDRDSHRAQLNLLRQQTQSAKQKTDECQVRLSSTRSQLHYLGQNITRAEKQLAVLKERRENLLQTMTDVQLPLPELKEALQHSLAQRLSVEAELTAARENVSRVESHLRELEKQRNRVEEETTLLRSRLEQIRLEQGAMQVRNEAHLEQIQQAGFQLESLLQEMPSEADPATWQQQIEQIENRIQRLGAINLAAIDEYNTLSERKTYLDSQNNDLVEALTTLENAIRKIDRESRARLRETFDKANATFSELFPKIFGGGNAHLELTDEDVLSTGILIKAQPPGKRNTILHLLSGGEKALTAIALVFSLFQLNPAPFCVLDEVDAPLDEANVGRFCNLVKEMSTRIQFIFISHNKVTMEMAQQLIGVTMNEPGVSRLVSVDIDEAIAMASK